MAKKTSVVQKILVPTDFSPKADQALKIACDLAKVTRAEIVLLHTIDLPYSTELRKEKLRTELEKSAKPALKEQVKWAKTELSRLKINVDSKLVIGNPIQAIVKEAGEGKYDLICMGNRISSGLRRFVFDNTTNGVIDLSPCPVLATTDKVKEVNLRNMIFGTDFREGDLNILLRISRLARELKSHIDVVHVCKRRSFDETLRLTGFERLAEKKVDYKDMKFHQFVDDDVDEGIETAIKAMNAGLVILSREHRSFLDALFGSDVIDDLVYKAEIPVLVFPITG